MTDFLFPDQKLLPPMSALRAFEAAARLGSFTIAAEELGVTQGAVSRQIKLLEDLLQVQLFNRTHHRVILTEAGRYYANHVGAILGRVMAASHQAAAFGISTEKLNIGIIPAFGSRWIVPKLPEFLAEHPRIQLRIRAIAPDMPLNEAELDAALLVGRGPWANTVAHRLAGEELIAVATPGWIKRFAVKSPQDLIGPPLLTHSPRPDLWSRWFALNAVDAHAAVPAQLTLEQISMIVEAALVELGAALLPRLLIRRELEGGELVVLPGEPLQVSDGFFFIYARHREDYPPLVAFRDWLLSNFHT
jgi:LysR family glycine cleavage system transcriptional activator